MLVIMDVWAYPLHFILPQFRPVKSHAFRVNEDGMESVSFCFSALSFEIIKFQPLISSWYFLLHRLPLLWEWVVLKIILYFTWLSCYKWLGIDTLTLNCKSLANKFVVTLMQQWEPDITMLEWHVICHVNLHVMDTKWHLNQRFIKYMWGYIKKVSIIVNGSMQCWNYQQCKMAILYIC